MDDLRFPIFIIPYTVMVFGRKSIHFPAHVWQHTSFLLRENKADSMDSGYLGSEIRIPSSGFFSLEGDTERLLLLPKRIKRRCSGREYCCSGGWTSKAVTMIGIGTLVHQLERVQRRVIFAFSRYWMCSIAVILHLTRYRNARKQTKQRLALPCSSLKHQS